MKKNRLHITNEQ